MTTLPDFKKGIDYWTAVDATVDGVLGGFGNGSLPRVEQLSSRLFLLSLLPQLQSFPSPLSSPAHQRPPTKNKRYLGLDVGAGVGRVTKNTLLPLLDDVITMEPVEHFIGAAKREASEGGWPFLEDRSGNAVSTTNRQKPSSSKNRDSDEEDESDQDENTPLDKMGNRIPRARSSPKPIKGKRVWFIQAPLNDLDPVNPLNGKEAKSLGVVGMEGKGLGGGDESFGEKMGEVGYDVIWCQWCLGHLSNPELVSFLKRCQAALLPPSSSSNSKDTSVYNDPGAVIVVKENVCENGPDGTAVSVLDEEDSSLTRSNKMWEEIFQQAGLKIVKEEVQLGLPQGLFMVKSWALR
ncbi:AdoMet dependent proline di-methyltransferase-domain-containing protein [Filobasidium floriforme]|uniref:AdoMet dependent proline di-methyltransferase-domain-containing protein n=1 Tax=Filobasidium floriforme TaxID=5210 RepID=UPI001E8EA232|nr:AdoMet dependent proline di-methyltransferase-domain-containing protein [Filobasidium floriforme]KAH8078325.1 AdoMet dependent proline di-methyltransferase-domain-containing protein [Filobasidium floriforme]